MENTANFASRCLIELLESKGIKYAVASPGSRNTPLLVALSRSERIRSYVVVDERSAAFVALGLAAVSQSPVAIICTSGTAMLNYAPAVAEAYYRRLPLIVISADRPLEWIDQDDSQTLRQRGALQNFVKNSYDIPAYDSPEMRWYTNRIINDALLTATQLPAGPVHINVQIPEPIGAMTAIASERQRVIDMITPREDLTVAFARELGKELASPLKVMVIAGFMQPDATLNTAIKKLSELPNFIILTENLSNLHGQDFVSDIDATLASLTDEEKEMMRPDVVITFGGALVSRFVKQYLRKCAPAQHWHVGKSLTTIDCFKSLTKRIEMLPAIFFQQLASAMQPHRQPSDYRARWIVLRDRARSVHQSFVAKAPWCDLKAFSVLMPLIPRNWNLQLSNGTPVRYAQLFTMKAFHRVDCNRGVSGIDGSTATAIGACMAYKSAPTILISGDMSAQYDIGSLGCGCIPSRFKMIVIDNGGGGIFRFIKSTRDLDIVNDFFAKPCCLPIAEIAGAYGFKVWHASDETELRKNFAEFSEATDAPALLVIHTSGEISAKALIEYFQIKPTTYNPHNIFNHENLDHD